jgi:3-oxoacyl-[acyl-carrier protein] reductase
MTATSLGPNNRAAASLVCSAAAMSPAARIEDLHRRGLLDEMTKQASLEAAPASFVAPLYAYLASDLAQHVTGQVFVAAGGFVGRFDRPTPRVLGYRDHRDAAPWSVEDLHTMIGA